MPMSGSSLLTVNDTNTVELSAHTHTVYTTKSNFRFIGTSNYILIRHFLDNHYNYDYDLHYYYFNCFIMIQHYAASVK